MEKFEIGQTVHVLGSMNSARRDEDRPWGTATIARVGRKYVYADVNGWGRESKFDPETGVEVTDYSGSARRIFTDEGKARFLRGTEIRSGLIGRHRVTDLSRGGYSLETLEAVLALLDADVASRTPVQHVTEFRADTRVHCSCGTTSPRFGTKAAADEWTWTHKQ
jgi:hypothetical protein